MLPETVRSAAPAAGIAGGALVIDMLLPWYGQPGGGSGTATAWQAFSVLDLGLAAVGLLGIALAVAARAGRAAGLAALLAAAGAIATGFLVWRIADPPQLDWLVLFANGAEPEAEREPALWAGLAACVVVTLAGLAALRQQRLRR